MKFKIKPEFFFKKLLIIIFLLLIGNIIVNFLKFSDFPKPRIVEIIIVFFDFDLEENLPTFYSTLAISIASLLLLIIAMRNKKRNLKYIDWLGLSFVFLFLAVDEFTRIHEYLWNPTHNLLQTTGLLYYSWYIPYAILFLIIAVFYIKWFNRLPIETKKLFVLSGLIFITGAIVFEAVSGYFDELYGVSNFWYCFFYTIEELLEMLGIALFIYALLEYISETKYLKIKIS